MKKLITVLTTGILLSSSMITATYAQSSGGIVFDTPTRSAAVSNDNTNSANANANTTSSTAQPILDAKLEIMNTTQNVDASKAKNKAGDTIKVTATLGNLGPGDLKSHPVQVMAEELLKLGSLIDAGDGGQQTLGKAVVYPAVNITEDCDCEETFNFTIKLNENMCTDFPSLVKTGALVKFEDQQKSLSFECTTATVVTPVTPVRTTPTQETTVPAVATPVVTATKAPVTKSGPEALILLGAAAAFGGFNLLRKRK